MEHTALSLEQQRVTTYGVIVSRLLPDAVQSLRETKTDLADSQAMVLDILGNRLIKDGRLSEPDQGRLSTAFQDSAALLPSDHPALDRLKSATTAMLDNSLEQRGTAFRQVQLEAGTTQLGASYDAAHFKQLHAHLTQDFLAVGEGGRLRPQERSQELPVPGRPENRGYFTPALLVEGRLDEIGAGIQATNNLRGLDKATFTDRAAQLYDELNHVQPFGRANEAVLTTALTQLGREAGYAVDFAKVAPGELRKAADVALAREDAGSQQPLQQLLARITLPAPEKEAALLRDPLGAAPVPVAQTQLAERRAAERDVQQAGNALAVHFIVQTMVSGGLTEAATRATVAPQMTALQAVERGQDVPKHLPTLRGMATAVEAGATPPRELLTKFRGGLAALEAGVAQQLPQVQAGAAEVGAERSTLRVGQLLPDAINTLVSNNLPQQAAVVRGFGMRLAATGELSSEEGSELRRALTTGQQQLPYESVALDRLKTAVEPFLSKSGPSQSLAREAGAVGSASPGANPVSRDLERD